MVAEVYAGIGAFKAMFDMAKGLKDIHDTAIRNNVIIELQQQILSAQVEQAALIERLREAEHELLVFEELGDGKREIPTNPTAIIPLTKGRLYVE